MMEQNNNFLPKFTVSDNLSNDLRSIKKAEAISTGWYKGKLDYNLRKAGFVKNINGIEYYTNIVINNNTYNFYNKGTKGYYIAEFLRLLGFENKDLDELHRTWRKDSVKGLSIRWKAKGNLTPERFKRYLEQMRSDLSGVDTIEIDYELQRYKASSFPLESSRVYNSRYSIYGKTKWGQGQFDFTNVDWTNDSKINSFDSIQTKSIALSIGNTIRFIRGGLDVTSEYETSLRYAVQSMIAYSGTDFMNLVSASKKSEKSYTVVKYSPIGSETTENYISVVGTEVYNPHILNAFITDVDNVQFFRYTTIGQETNILGIGNSRSSVIAFEENTKDMENRIPLTNGQSNAQYGLMQGFYMTTAFWNYANYSATNTYTQKTVTSGDEFLFKDMGSTAFINVDEFKKLTLDDAGSYIGEYFDIVVDQKSGGFFSGFIGAIAGFMGAIFNFTFKLIQIIPPLRLNLQAMTWVVNKIFNSEFTEKQVYGFILQAGLLAISILFPISIPVMIAASLAVSLAIAGDKANDAKEEAEKEAERKKKEQEDIQKQKEIDAKKEEMKRKQNGGDEQSKDDMFQSFLKDPLFMVKTERQKMIPDMKSQFKLL